MTTESSTSKRRAFAEAAAAFVQIVDQIDRDAWERPGLGEWDLRALVGHTSRSLSTIEAYLGRASTAGSLDSPVAYYQAAQAALADAEAVAQRGRDAGTALGDDPASAVRALAQRVLALVEASADDEPVGTPVGAMRLADYLPTRIFELAVHSLDLARALDIDPPASLASGVSAACELAGQLAASSSQSSAVLLALTGRADLPPGFSLV